MIHFLSVEEVSSVCLLIQETGRFLSLYKRPSGTNTRSSRIQQSVLYQEVLIKLDEMLVSSLLKCYPAEGQKKMNHYLEEMKSLSLSMG